MRIGLLVMILFVPGAPSREGGGAGEKPAFPSISSPAAAVEDSPKLPSESLGQTAKELHWSNRIHSQ